MLRLSQIFNGSRQPHSARTTKFVARRSGRRHRWRLATGERFATLRSNAQEIGALEDNVLRSLGAALLVVTIAAAAGRQGRAQEEFPIAGTYTENTPCAGADARVLRVRITARDIDSPILGLCSILEKKRDGDKIAAHVECKGPGGVVMLGDINFTIKNDKTLDFADQDNTYKATLHKCPD